MTVNSKVRKLTTVNTKVRKETRRSLGITLETSKTKKQEVLREVVLVVLSGLADLTISVVLRCLVEEEVDGTTLKQSWHGGR